MSRKEFIAQTAMQLRQTVYRKCIREETTVNHAIKDEAKSTIIERTELIDTINMRMAVKEAIVLADELEKSEVAPWIA